MQHHEKAPADKRYRVCLTETLSYAIDVVARDEDEARLSLDLADRTDAPSSDLAADSVTVVPAGDAFRPDNACVTCGARAKDIYPHCSARIERIKLTNANGHTA